MRRKIFKKLLETDRLSKSDAPSLFASLFSSDVEDSSCPEDNTELNPCEVQAFIAGKGVSVRPVIDVYKLVASSSQPIIDVSKLVELSQVYPIINVK